jgi:hypothetical protein
VSECIKRAKNGEHDVMIYAWTGAPDYWLGVLYRCAAIKGRDYAKWCHPEYGQQVQKARLSSDHDEPVKWY